MVPLFIETATHPDKSRGDDSSATQCKRQTVIRNLDELFAKAKSGSVLRTNDGRLYLARFDRRYPNAWPEFRHLVVRVKKRGLEPRARRPYCNILPAVLVYSPSTDINSLYFTPKYYLPDGTPNPNQFEKKPAECRQGFSEVPNRCLSSGTVVELSIGGFAVLPAGYSPEDQEGSQGLYMRRVNKDGQLGARACRWSAATYGGVRVVWEPDDLITEEEAYASSRFTPEGLPERVTVLKQHFDDQAKSTALVHGAL